MTSTSKHMGDTNSHTWPHTLTCGDKEDACTEDDVVSAPVKLTSSHTEPPQEQQTHAHDGEDTGGTHSTCAHTNMKGSETHL